MGWEGEGVDGDAKWEIFSNGGHTLVLLVERTVATPPAEGVRLRVPLTVICERS